MTLRLRSGFTLAVAFCLTALTAGVALAGPLSITATDTKITQTSPVVQFNLANPGQEAATSHIFNLQGEDVGQLTAQSLERFSWDGKDVDQQPVVSGMYVVQIHHHGQVWHGPIFVNR